ncbi:hypothetical protein [Streptomyces sp. IBSBF 3136]|uniref:hypothetical protein n=1 Tax=Streptomyces sp. IBSBF 3136 TaxID=2903524 RepID=UPI002FDC0D11
MIRAGVISADADRSGLQRVVLPPGTAPLRREFLAVHRPGLRPPVIDELITQLPPAPRSLRP